MQTLEKMKIMITKQCLFPSCHNIAQNGSCYCDVHQKDTAPKGNGNKKPFASAKRSSENFYNTSRWRTLRRKHIEKEPYCVRCGSELDLTVDHIQNADGIERLFFNENNLQTRCRTCHNQKTLAEIQHRQSLLCNHTAKNCLL